MALRDEQRNEKSDTGCCASCCGGRRRRRKRKEKADPSDKEDKQSNQPSLTDNDEKEPTMPTDSREMSESPVPDIPLATPEGSDDENGKSKPSGGKPTIGSPSMVSIDRDEDESCSEKENNTRDTKDVNGVEKSREIRSPDEDKQSQKNKDLKDIMSVLPAIPSYGGTEIPSYLTPIKQLYCRTGFHLAIRPNGKVEGVRDEYHPDAVLEFRSPAAGEVWIKGKKSGLYLTMNKNGRLFGQPNACHEGSLFYEQYSKGYNRYLSKQYRKKKWFVGIKKSGKAKPGHKTRKRQKSVQFLPRSIKQ